MKRIVDFAGGRGLVNDDLLTLQTQLDNLNAIYQEVGPFVVYGVEFTLNSGTTYDVSAGLVMLNGRLIEFPAQQMDLNLSKAITQAAEADVDIRQYDGLAVSKPGAKEYLGEIVNGQGPLNPGDNIFITTASGGFGPQVRRLSHALQEATLIPGMVVPVIEDIDAKFDTVGPASGNDEWFGWRLLTRAPFTTEPDLRDQVMIGAGAAFSVGDTQTNTSPSGAGVTTKTYALHFVEFRGTRSTATNTL